MGTLGMATKFLESVADAVVGAPDVAREETVAASGNDRRVLLPTISPALAAELSARQQAATGQPEAGRRCVSCRLSLSVAARYCRRCGRVQPVVF